MTDREAFEFVARGIAAARYQVVRWLNKREFAALVDDCLYKDLRFDDEVDKIGGIK